MILRFIVMIYRDLNSHSVLQTLSDKTMVIAYVQHDAECMLSHGSTAMCFAMS